MRTVCFAEGAGSVAIHKGRGDVRHNGRYVGRITRLANGRWRPLTQPHLSFRDPVEAAEVAAEFTA